MASTMRTIGVAWLGNTAAQGLRIIRLTDYDFGLRTLILEYSRYTVYGATGAETADPVVE